MKIIMIVKILVISHIYLSASLVDAVIGVNWGRNAIANLAPSVVIDLFLQNGIQEVKVFSSELKAIRAFKGTNIGVTVTLANPNAVANKVVAREWLRNTIEPFPDVNFRYVSVGNNAFSLARKNNISFTSIVNRVRILQDVLDEIGYGNKIKVIITHSLGGVLNKTNVLPSKSEFLPDVQQAMLEMLDIMTKNGAPFFIEFQPFEQVSRLGLDIEFAFSDEKSKIVVRDINGVQYTNLFDLVYDSFVWALKKYGYADTKIIVCQIGWPTDGYQGADVKTAERFWKTLLPRVASNRGTPMRPGEPIDINVHALTDENNNPQAFMPYARHWGIYRANGQPKYKIDLTGQGRDIFPTAAQGINLMPARWCIFNGDMRKPQMVKDQFELACANADCTCLSPGGSCGMLNYEQNVSYAFNAHFQSSFQDDETCDFKGLGRLVVENPSIGGCIYSVEVVRGTTQSLKPIRKPKN